MDTCDRVNALVPGAQPEATTDRAMTSTKNTTMNEVSSIPAGGITRRTGRRTGSVRSMSSRESDARNVPSLDREPRDHRATDQDDEVDGEQPRDDVCARSGLEQTTRLQPLLLLLGHLDVGGREQENLVVDPFHLGAHRVRKAAREVDQPSLELLRQVPAG